MKTQELKHAVQLAEWKEKAAEYRSGGQTVNGCCQAQGIAIESVLESYLSHLRQKERSEATVQKYGKDVARFLRFTDGQIDKAALLRWKASLMAGEYMPQTVNGMLAAVNGLFDFLGLGDQKVKPVKCQRAVFRAKERELTKAEYFRLLDAAKRKGKKQLLLIMETVCATGIRISELQYITVESARAGRATVRCKGKCRVILIPKKLCGQLLNWAGGKKISSGPIFLTRGGKCVDRSNIWRGMKALCASAGLDPRKVFPHNLRHLFAVVFYQAEKDLAKLADVLGHTSINTTRIYIMETGEEHERQLSRLGLLI